MFISSSVIMVTASSVMINVSLKLPNGACGVNGHHKKSVLSSTKRSSGKLSH